MEILTITNIVKKDIPLHYRNEYSGEILYKTLSGVEETAPIDFVMERNALGDSNIFVKFVRSPDYPLVPALKSVKSHILGIDQRGALP